MTRAYNVIDADGHILEPLSLWADYMDPDIPRPCATIDRSTPTASNGW